MNVYFQIWNLLSNIYNGIIVIILKYYNIEHFIKQGNFSYLSVLHNFMKLYLGKKLASFRHISPHCQCHIPLCMLYFVFWLIKPENNLEGRGSSLRKHTTSTFQLVLMNFRYYLPGPTSASCFSLSKDAFKKDLLIAYHQSLSPPWEMAEGLTDEYTFHPLP